MNRSLLLGTALVAALTCGAADVEWLSTDHDFGAFSEDDGKVTATFRFVNPGPEPVAITSVRANCGCTTPFYTRQAVAPGDTARVELTYNPTGRPGRFTKKAYVVLSDNSPRTTLTISGVVIGAANTLRSRYPVEAGPLKLRSTVVPFGEAKKHSAKTAYVETYNASPLPVVPRFERVPPYIRVVSANDTVSPGEQTTFALILNADDTPLYGVVADSLLFVPAAGAEPLKIDLVSIIEEDFSRLTPGQMAKAPAASVDDKRVDFGTFRADGGALVRKIKLHNRGKSDLLIRRVYSLDPGVTIESSSAKVGKGKSATLTITVDPSRLPSELLDDRAMIITNDPSNSTTTLRLVGINQF